MNLRVSLVLHTTEKEGHWGHSTYPLKGGRFMVHMIMLVSHPNCGKKRKEKRKIPFSYNTGVICFLEFVHTHTHVVKYHIYNSIILQSHLILWEHNDNVVSLLDDSSTLSFTTKNNETYVNMGSTTLFTFVLPPALEEKPVYHQELFVLRSSRSHLPELLIMKVIIIH